ncbi:MAG TPA: DinB family protein [Candidatus Dormibacteraeota bacterium]
MEPLLVEAFRYNKWANLHLLDVCSGFSEEQLQMTSRGTYGTLAATFLHMLAAEQRYIKRLGGAEPQINERDETFPGVAALREHAVRSGDALIEIAPRITPEEAHESKYSNRPFMLHSWVVLIQALHHGNDHRTHICTILGHYGLTYGDMDVWAYGQATGGLTPIEAAT